MSKERKELWEKIERAKVYQKGYEDGMHSAFLFALKTVKEWLKENE